MQLFKKKNDPSEAKPGDVIQSESPGGNESTPNTTSNPQNGSGIAARVAAGKVGNGTSPQSLPSPDGGKPKGKKRGRPDTGKGYSQALGSDGKTKVKIPGCRPDGTPIDTQGGSVPRFGIPQSVLEKFVKEGITITEKKIYNTLEARGQYLGLTTAEIEPHLKQTEMSETQKKLVAEMTPHVLREWGLNPELSPTALMAAIVAPWVAANMSALRTLKKLCIEKREMEKAEQEKKEAIDNGTTRS